MQLNEIVKINESGTVANAVSFDLMDDQEKNLHLCQGFVFNYKQNDPKSSTLGVLDEILKSYQSVNRSNIHLFVQDYGKGKSHFALVSANFFKQSPDSPEVKGILSQIKIASEDNQGLIEDFTVYKRRNSQHLVICIDGASGLDLRQIFLKSLRKTLKNEGISESLAQNYCQKPLDYLKSLTQDQIAIANDFLEEKDYPGDINSLMELLALDDYKVITIVKEISCKLNKGFAIDLETDLSPEQILEELITTLCSGKDAKYAGILILFDELNAYLQSWSKDPFNAGGLTLQNITNACEKYKSKIALVCFTQIRPSNSVPSQSVNDYKKLASRLEIAESTYEPISNLELVIKGLLDQQKNSDSWQKFHQRWNSTLLDDTRKAHETRINIYRERGWELQDFFDNLTLGCFPLHPLNSYILCNLDFTQGRTAIQYLKEDVKKFIKTQPVEKNGKLNYLPAISLVDAFKSNFSQPEFSRHYTEYQKAYDTIASSATEKEIAVLKGLFLFYVSQSKLNKSESEKHDVILGELTGLSEKEIKETLDTLSQARQVIYSNTGDNTYRFYSGSNLLEVRYEIEEEVSKKLNQVSINLAVAHCQKEVTTYFQSEQVEATEFINRNELLNDQWFFEYKFYTIAELKQALSSPQTLKNITGKGIFAYVLAETLEELQSIHRQINHLISQSEHKERIAVAIPSKPVIEICKDLFSIEIITRKGTLEKQESGTAYGQYKKQLQDKIKREVKEIIGFPTYYCIGSEQLTTAQKKSRESIVSHLLQQLYRFVPPLAKNDKMALKSTAGNKIIGYTSNHLLEDDLNPKNFENKSYPTLINQVFVSGWGLLKTSSQKYSVQIPSHKNVREAWDRIDQLTALGGKKRISIQIEKIWQELSNPPFGYNECTFIILFTSWIAYHRSEVLLSGSFGIPKNSKEQVKIQEKPIKDWATTNVFTKPKDFVEKWILGSTKPRLIRSQAVVCPEIPKILDYNQAQKLIADIDQFLNSVDPDPAKVQEVTSKRKQLASEIKKIDDWFSPVEEIENFPHDINLDLLLKVYPRLQQQPSKVVDIASPLKSDNIVVNPTKQQYQHQAETLQFVQEKIEEVVIQLSEKSESLKTEQEYGYYQGELETSIEKITQVSSLPSHLIETLNSSLDVARKKLGEIKYKAKIQECLEKIEIRYNALSENASQEDYIKAISEIESLTNNLEIVKQESQYQEIMQDIATKQSHLEKMLEIWSEQLGHITKNEALKLSQEVSQQKNRFTLTESTHKVKQILNQLEPIILSIQDEEESKKLKQQQDADIMQQLRQKQPKFLNTITLCEQGITEINDLRVQLHYPKRFNTEIEQLVNNLNYQISNFKKQLKNAQDQIAQVETSKNLQVIQTNLAKLDFVFKDSDDYSIHQQLFQDLSSLSHFFQIAEKQANTPEAYKDQINQLNKWYDNLINSNSNLETRYNQHKSKLEEKIQRLEEQKKAEAKLWLDQIQQRFSQLDQEPEEYNLEKTHRLIQEIKQKQLIYLADFTLDQKQLLESINQQCLNIQNESQENQIITLFTQLPPQRQQNLYFKLKQYLSKEEAIND